MSYTLKDLKFDIKTFVAKHPTLYPLYWIYPKFRHRLVAENTEICIEGFPRSGNTFAFHTFKYFNPEVLTAHHVHAPVQISKAINNKIPCILMIRNPLDTIASLIIVDNDLKIETALKHYISFYKRVLKYKEDIIIADISTINNEFDKLINKINLDFNKSYNSKSLSQELIKDIKEIVKLQNKKANNPDNLVAIPTYSKDSLKVQIKPNILKNNLYSKAVRIFNVIDKLKVKF